MYTNSIAQFISIIIELVADSQNSGKSNTTVSEMMSQAWKNTLESLYMRVNPGLIRQAITTFKLGTKHIIYKFIDPNGVNHTKPSQAKFVFHKYFSQLNIDEQIFPILTEQCKKLKDTKKSPFENITDEELINLLNFNKLEEHIINFINQSLKNKPEFLSFLKEHNEDFFSAFKSHFYAIANSDKINIIMNTTQCQQLEQQSQQLEINTNLNKIQCQQLEQQSQQLEQLNQQLEQQRQQLEQLNKNQKNLVEKDEKFYEISITSQETTSPKRKKEKKVAYCYSKYGEFVLMAGSYITLNVADKCPANIIKLREQYADYIAEDGLVLKGIHFNNKTADATIVNFVNYSQDYRKKPKPIRKKYKKFFKNAYNEWEYDISYKQLKK
jgi:cell division protein FtsB